MEKYIPKVIEDRKNSAYVEILVELEKCNLCNKLMVPKTNIILFPHYNKINQNAQMNLSGLVYKSGITVDGEYICDDCKISGKATILCVICNENKSSEKVQEAVGYYAEYMCTDCYETVSAKKWDETYHYLIEKHKYD